MQLHAQPYTFDAIGFYFESAEEYQTKYDKNRDDFGNHVEEYEIQFIDGTDFECELAKAVSIHQGNIKEFFDAVEEMDLYNDNAKAALIWLLKDNQKTWAQVQEMDEDDLADYVFDSYGQYKSDEQVYDEVGYMLLEDLRDVPEHLRDYIDFRAYGRDYVINGCSIETIMGNTYVFNQL